MNAHAVQCPVCGQDWVRRARIVGTDIGFWLCSECESIWLSADWIDAETSEFLGEFLTSHGYRPTFDDVEMLDR
jgi:ribosomal protein L37AE/L43A